MTVPEMLGAYRLIERLSTGGMAEVYLAERPGASEFTRLYALKCILPSLVKEKSFVEMFIDEARITGQLNHANIAQTHELGCEHGVYYIAMEYVVGIDLLSLFRALYKHQRTMPLPISMYVGYYTGIGLHHAHTRVDEQGNPLRIVHRDCSPQNIITTFDGEVKVIDFGIAKAAERVSKTHVGVRKGKFRYMSPEQLMGEAVDARSDVFSLGTVLWECFAGRPAFDQDSDYSVASAVRAGNYSPPSTIKPGVDPRVDAIVLKAMAPRPQDRFASCQEFAEAMRSFALSQGGFPSAIAVGQWLRDQAQEAYRAQLARIERRVQPKFDLSTVAPVEDEGSTKMIRAGGSEPKA